MTSDLKLFKHRPPIRTDLLRKYSIVSSWKSLALCIGIYGGVAGLAWLGSAGSNWWLAPFSILVIAGLQNHLLILLHEGAHRMIHPNSKVNDWIADIFCGIPLFTTVNQYRAFHLTHHKYTGDPQRDPEVPLYREQGYFYQRTSNKWKVAKMLAIDLLGINAIRFSMGMIQRNRKIPGHKAFTARDLFLNTVFWIGIPVAAFYFGFMIHFIVFWVLPLITVTFLLLKLHGYGEHTGLSGPSEFERTWIHDFNPITDFFIYPIRSGYHLEHHLFPMIPWYHMKAFRQLLIKNPYYLELSEKVTVDGYFFGKNTVFGSMIYGKDGYYTDEPYFQKGLKKRQLEVEKVTLSLKEKKLPGLKTTENKNSSLTKDSSA